jgi:DNA-directed RNA polymerase subunit RPC12/RpoP
MPDIIYPDCQRKIPSYEVECPNCSFLLQKYLQENGIDNLKKKILCTRCGQEGNGLMGAVKIKCEYCNIPMVQTRYGIREFVILYNESLEGVPEKVMDSMGISEREYQDMVRRRDPRIFGL